MNIKNLSDQSLSDLHELIREALEKDDASTGGKQFGVREYPDWKKQADDFEAELANRKKGFKPIDWSPKT